MHLFVFTAIFSFIDSLNIDFSLIRTVDASMPDNGNTFSTPNDRVADCEHRSRHRDVIMDNSDYAQSPRDCTYCDQPALNGTQGQYAITCERCGATICQSCDAPNSDTESDSGAESDSE